MGVGKSVLSDPGLLLPTLHKLRKNPHRERKPSDPQPVFGTQDDADRGKELLIPGNPLVRVQIFYSRREYSQFIEAAPRTRRSRRIPEPLKETAWTPHPLVQAVHLPQNRASGSTSTPPCVGVTSTFGCSALLAYVMQGIELASVNGILLGRRYIRLQCYGHPVAHY